MRARLAAWLVNGSRILSGFHNCPDDKIEVVGQVEEHRQDIVELLRRVVPAARAPYRVEAAPVPEPAAEPAEPVPAVVASERPQRRRNRDAPK